MELPSFYRTFLWNMLRHFVVASALTAPAALAQVYSVTQLKQEVATFLGAEYRQVAHERIDINVNNMDARLRLGTCAQALDFTNQDPTGLGGNISVKVACNSGKMWSVHVPAQVIIFRSIPIAVKNITRGEVIGMAHLATQVVDISNIRQAFFSDAAAIIGKEAKRNIGQGEPFKTALVDAPTAIKRGEIVAVESVTGGLKVTSAGTALADGRIGQKIRVRNNSSERIISGVVVRQGVVQTL